MSDQKNVLIALYTCRKNAERAQACRDTWVPLVLKKGYDVEFMDGDRLGVPDDYRSLPLKTKSLMRWALAHEYKDLVKCDDDTYIHAENLRRVVVDYAGSHIPPNDKGNRELGIPDFPKGTFKFSYANGGCYWLSERAVRILTDAPLNDEWAEDRWVGQALAQAGIFLTVIPNLSARSKNFATGEMMGWRQNITKSTMAVLQIPTVEEIWECHRLFLEK